MLPPPQYFPKFPSSYLVILFMNVNRDNWTVTFISEEPFGQVGIWKKETIQSRQKEKALSTIISTIYDISTSACSSLAIVI